MNRCTANSKSTRASDGSDILNGFTPPCRSTTEMDDLENIMTALRAALLAAAAATSLLPAAALANDSGATPAAHMRVDYDHSTIVHLERPAKTIVIGNPAIADALLIDDKTVSVLGRMFGNTNIIALDSSGAEVLDVRITVGAPESAQVTLYRGAQGQRNLACAPQCERNVTPGDPEMSGVVQDADKKTESAQKSAQLSGGK